MCKTLSLLASAFLGQPAPALWPCLRWAFGRCLHSPGLLSFGSAHVSASCCFFFFLSGCICCSPPEFSNRRQRHWLRAPSHLASDLSESQSLTSRVFLLYGPAGWPSCTLSTLYLLVWTLGSLEFSQWASDSRHPKHYLPRHLTPKIHPKVGWLLYFRLYPSFLEGKEYPQLSGCRWNDSESTWKKKSFMISRCTYHLTVQVYLYGLKNSSSNSFYLEDGSPNILSLFLSSFFLSHWGQFTNFYHRVQGKETHQHHSKASPTYTPSLEKMWVWRPLSLSLFDIYVRVCACEYFTHYIVYWGNRE